MPITGDAAVVIIVVVVVACYTSLTLRTDIRRTVIVMDRCRHAKLIFAYSFQSGIAQTSAQIAICVVDAKRIGIVAYIGIAAIDIDRIRRRTSMAARVAIIIVVVGIIFVVTAAGK